MPPKRRGARQGEEPSSTQAKIKEPLTQEKSGKTTSKKASRDQLKAKPTTEKTLTRPSPETSLATRQRRTTAIEPRDYNLRSRKEPTSPPEEKSKPVHRKATKGSTKSKPRTTVTEDNLKSSVKVSKRKQQEAGRRARDPIGDWVEQIPEGIPIEEASAIEKSPNINVTALRQDLEYDSRVLLDMPPKRAVLSPGGSQRPTLPLVKESELGTTTTQARGVDDILRSRNVTLEECQEERRKDILEMIHAERPVNTVGQEALEEREERGWQFDLKMCEEGPEIIFQRTIMMEVIDRYGFDEKILWNAEQLWDCPRMPQNIPIGQANDLWPMPKPDLIVAFKTNSILPTRHAMNELLDLSQLICPEKSSNTYRAFPFFAMEVKGTKSKDENTSADRQNFNTASQALHNIWVFMNEAKDQTRFYDEVRFYSAAATSVGFRVRVHRAVKDEADSIDNEYPLSFEYDEIFRVGEKYPRKTVSRVIQNILLEYGVNQLFPILQQTVATVVKARKEKKNQIRKQLLDRRQQELGERPGMGQPVEGEDAPVQSHEEILMPSSGKRPSEDLSSSVISGTRRRLNGFGLQETLAES